LMQKAFAKEDSVTGADAKSLSWWYASTIATSIGFLRTAGWLTGDSDKEAFAPNIAAALAEYFSPGQFSTFTPGFAEGLKLLATELDTYLAKS